MQFIWSWTCFPDKFKCAWRYYNLATATVAGANLPSRVTLWRWLITCAKNCDHPVHLRQRQRTVLLLVVLFDENILKSICSGKKIKIMSGFTLEVVMNLFVPFNSDSSHFHSKMINNFEHILNTNIICATVLLRDVRSLACIRVLQGKCVPF